MNNSKGQNLFNTLVVSLATITLAAFLYTRLFNPQLVSQNQTSQPDTLLNIDQQVISKITAATVAIQGRTFNNQLIINSSSGSGVFISQNGTILTNEHVIDGCELIYVVDHTGTSVTAKVIATDKRLDIAILQIEPDTDTAFLPFGDTASLKHGQTVIAAGNPFNTGSDGHAVLTFGRISRLNEKTTSSPDFANDRFYSNLIQIDASVFPGNSGGPLTDEYGNIIGIITAVSKTNVNHPIGYAICLDDSTHRAIDTLTTGQNIEHGFLGAVLANEIPYTVIKEYKLTNLSGAYVASVLPGSPAVQAGILPGDIIKNIANKPVNNRTDLISIVNAQSPGSLTEIQLVRPSFNYTIVNKTLIAKLEDRTLENRDGYYQEVNMPQSSAWGVVVKPVTKWRRNKTGLPGNQDGVLVYEVDINSMAFKQGIKPGDIIIKVDSLPIKNIEDFELITAKSVFSPRFKTWQNNY